MKEVKKGTVLLLIISALFITGCNNNEQTLTQPDENNDNEGKITVYTSFYTLYDFVSKIGGENVEVINMIPQGGDPHHWEPTASDIINLEEADVFIYNGLELEHWVEGVLNSIDNKDLLVLEASEGIDPIESTHSHHGEHNVHDHDEHEDHDHHHGEMDPHIWLDPMRAKTIFENIKNTMLAADPENEEYYERNYQQYAEELDELDEEYSTNLGKLKNRDMVVSHEAYGYLSETYNLNQIGIDGLIPDSEPSPSRMAEIIDHIQENNIETIFFEDINDTQIVDAIANETGIETEILYTLEYLTDDQISDGDDYFSVMRQNLDSLMNGLNR